MNKIQTYEQHIEAVQWDGTEETMQLILNRYKDKGVIKSCSITDNFNPSLLTIQYEFPIDDQFFTVGEFIIFDVDRMYHESEKDFLALYHLKKDTQEQSSPGTKFTGLEPAFANSGGRLNNMLALPSTGINLLAYFMAHSNFYFNVPNYEISHEKLAVILAQHRLLQAKAMIEALNQEISNIQS